MSDLQLLQGKTSTRIPVEARVINKSKASLRINRMLINILPDKIGNMKRGSGAKTKIRWRYSGVRLAGNGQVSPPRISVKIQTVYKRGVQKSSRSAYGRGTTGHDRANNNTSLRFHESQHGADFLQFMRAHQPPRFGDSKSTMTPDEFRAAGAQFAIDIKKYFEKLDKYSTEHTDCVGESIDTVQGAHFCET